MKHGVVRIGMALAMLGLLVTSTMALRIPLAQAAEKAAATTQKADQKKDVKKETRYIGSKEAKKYHKPSCEWVKKINKENRVEFASAADATKAGYVPCKVCLGTKDTSKTDTKTSKTSKSRAASPTSASPKSGQ